MNGEAYTEGEKPASNFDDPNADFLRPSTFRTGIYQLLTQNKSMFETAGVHVVTRIKGDVNKTCVSRATRAARRRFVLG